MYANLLSAATQFLTPDLIAKMASASGLDSAAAQKTAGAAVPAILSGLASLASSSNGARQLSNVIAEQPQNTLANLADMIGSSTRIADTGKTLLSSLLGGGALNALVSAVAKFAGIGDGSSRSMLGMLAPMVLGILGREQREGGLNTSGLAQMLASQKDQFAAAMPAGLSEHLNRSGFFDRLGAMGRADDTHPTARATAPMRAAATPPSSTHWAYWAIPLAALAGLGLYLLSGDWSRREDATRTTEATKTPTMQPTKAVSTATETDIGRQVTETINSLQGHLQGMRDAGAASAALPKLREMSGQLDRLTELASQLPPEARERVASSIKAANAKVKSTLDSIGPVADTTPGVRPTLDALRAKLDTLAGARLAYFAKAPADLLAVTAYFSRDVYNRAGEKLGTVNDLLVAPDGRITAAIIGVGGFLGIGEKEIALPFSSMQSARRDNTWHIVIDANKEVLKDAPTFEHTGERARFKLSPKQ